MALGLDNTQHLKGEIMALSLYKRPRFKAWPLIEGMDNTDQRGLRCC